MGILYLMDLVASNGMVLITPVNYRYDADGIGVFRQWKLNRNGAGIDYGASTVDIIGVIYSVNYNVCYRQ